MSRRISIFGASFASVSFLLDNPAIAAGIAAPFALFRLKSGYTGPIVDVRRTVGVTTTIVSVGLGSSSQFTLDAPVTGVVTGSSSATNLGEFVAAAGYADPDSLGSAQDWFYIKGYNQNSGTQVWEQLSATSQPRGGTAGVMAMRNGRAEMVFDGSNDWCNFGLIGGATKPADWSVIGVGAFNLVSGLRVFCTSASQFVNAMTWGYFGRRSNAANKLELSYGNGDPVADPNNYRLTRTTANTITTGQQMLMEWYKETGVIDGSVYTDGVAQSVAPVIGTSVDSGGTNGTFSLGGFGSLIGVNFSGGAQFIGVWLTDKESERLAIKQKLNEILGTTW